MFYLVKRLCAALTCFMLASCFAPEKGAADLTINKDGSYSFTYRGGVAFLVGLAEQATAGKGSLRPKDIADIDAAMMELAKDREFKSVKKSGFSRVDVVYEADRKPGQSLEFIGHESAFLTVVPNLKTKQLMVMIPAFEAKNVQELKSLGFQPDFTLTVKCALPVIKHNGAFDRAIFFGTDTYSWHITLKPQPASTLVAKLP